MNQRSASVANKASKLLEKAAAQIKRSSAASSDKFARKSAPKSGFTSFTIPNDSVFDRTQIESHDSHKFVTSTPDSNSKLGEFTKTQRFHDATLNKQDELPRKKVEENVGPPPKSKNSFGPVTSLSRSTANNEYDEIQAYLQSLSRKTKTEAASATKASSAQDASDSQILSKSGLSLSLSELSPVEKVQQRPPVHSTTAEEYDFQSSKVSAKENASAVKTSQVAPSRLSTALEKASFYDGKYRKTKNDQPKKDILDSDSDFSFNEFKSLDSPRLISPPQSVDADEIVPLGDFNREPQTKTLADPYEDKEDSNKPSPMMQLHNLHTVEELLESFAASSAKDMSEPKINQYMLADKTQTVSEISEEFEELEESISEASSAAVEKTTRGSAEGERLSDHREPSIRTISVAESPKSDRSSVPNDAPNTEPASYSTDKEGSDSSSKILKNVYLHSIGDISQQSVSDSSKDEHTIVSSKELSKSKVSSKTETQPGPSEKSPTVKDRRHHTRRYTDASVQTPAATTSLVDIVMNPPLVNYAWENSETYTAVTRYMIRQETIEALVSSSPAILAASELLKHQLAVTSQMLASQQNLYVQTLAALQPDYEYTTWKKTKEEIRRYRRKQMLFDRRHKLSED